MQHASKSRQKIDDWIFIEPYSSANWNEMRGLEVLGKKNEANVDAKMKNVDYVSPRKN